MSKSGSVSEWIEGVKNQDSHAAIRLWGRFHQKLLHLTRRRMDGASRRVVDEDDVVSIAFHSFLHRAGDGQFPDLTNRSDLWKLLITITDRKIVNNIRQNTTIKRGYGRVVSESAFDRMDQSESFLTQAEANELPPNILVSLGELLNGLDDDLRQTVLLRQQGYTNEEIGKRLNRSVTTVERRLRLLRAKWERELMQ